MIENGGLVSTIERETQFISVFFFSSEMAGLLVTWLSTTPPYFATKLC